MEDQSSNPELKPLHSDRSLIPLKLAVMETWSGEVLLASLAPNRAEF